MYTYIEVKGLHMHNLVDTYKKNPPQQTRRKQLGDRDGNT